MVAQSAKQFQGSFLRAALRIQLHMHRSCVMRRLAAFALQLTFLRGKRLMSGQRPPCHLPNNHPKSSVTIGGRGHFLVERGIVARNRDLRQSLAVTPRRRSRARIVGTTCKGAHWIERLSRWPACIQHISIGVVKGVCARFLYCRLCERRQFTADCEERDRSENSKHRHLMLLV